MKSVLQPHDDMERIPEAAWAEGAGDTAPSRAGTLGGGSFYWWANFEPDIAVKGEKDTDSSKSSFDSFNSLVGSQSIH